MKVFYTDDCIDHICAAAIVKYKFPECELCVMDINSSEDAIFKDIVDNEKVFLLNATSNLEAYVSHLNKICELFWFSTLSHPKDDSNFISGVRKSNNNLSELVWKYLFSEKLPPIIYLFKNGSIKDILTFKYGLVSRNPDPCNDALWEQLLGDWSCISFDVIVKEGVKIYRYMHAEALRYWNNYSFEIEIMNMRCVVLNKYNDMFQFMVKEKQCDVLILFLWKQNKWECELYSSNDDADIIKIGHSLFDKYEEGDENKAVFTCTSLPFNKYLNNQI